MTEMNYNNIIIQELTHFALLEKSNHFKFNAYQKVIKNINSINIKSIDDIKKIKGVGKSIYDKIKTIIEKNTDIENIILKADFTNIYGIGIVKSEELIRKYNIKSIEELRNNLELLNNKQKIGLKYYEDLLLRIPIKEMNIHNEYIKKEFTKIDKECKYSLVGSYRRKEKTSGDIDILLITKYSMKYFIEKMSDYIIEILALSDKKFMGICKLDSYFRRIDILITNELEYPYALLYFTGSKEHNIMMRIKANKLGYVLNEKKIMHENTVDKEIPIMKTEKDIFKFLDIEYKEPFLRK
jgi:DNA polymerase/3'-5' exonuclease PolX